MVSGLLNAQSQKGTQTVHKQETVYVGKYPKGQISDQFIIVTSELEHCVNTKVYW